VTDEEPKYLRRQKPVEISPQETGRQDVVVLSPGVCVVGSRRGAEYAGYFWRAVCALFAADDAGETGPDCRQRQSHLGAGRNSKAFVHDRNRSVLRIPLETRRGQIQEIPWVEEASVQRILPNRLRVEITERTLWRFSATGNELTLIDAHGVLLERPEGEDFHFPIVTGCPKTWGGKSARSGCRFTRNS